MLKAYQRLFVVQKLLREKAGGRSGRVGELHLSVFPRLSAASGNCAATRNIFLAALQAATSVTKRELPKHLKNKHTSISTVMRKYRGVSKS